MSLISTCLYCCRLVNTNDGLLCENHYAEELAYQRMLFYDDIFNLLPKDWKRRFRVKKAFALKIYSLDNYIAWTYILMPKENIDSIMELCIINSHLDDQSLIGNNPYDVLEMLERKGAKFNGELYELTRNRECDNSERILKLFCNKPTRKIQYTWLRYRERKRNIAIQIIQQKVREWLYRPGGPMMKKFEEHFNQLAVTHTN